MSNKQSDKESNTNPAREWRRIIFDTFLRYRQRAEEEGAEGEAGADFLRYVEEEEQRTRAALAQLTREGGTAQTLSGTRNALFVLGVARLSYGRLDAVADIIDNLPPPPAPARMLARCVEQLLPLPKDLDVFAQPEAVKAWVEMNRSQLVWDERAGNFVFSRSTNAI